MKYVLRVCSCGGGVSLPAWGVRVEIETTIAHGARFCVTPRMGSAG